MLIKIAAWCWHIIRTIMDWCRRVFTKITKVEIKDDVWNGFVQFVKFGLVGLSNTVISYATYYILVPFHVNKYVGSVIGFILSVANAFYWNNSYAFKRRIRSSARLCSFIKLFLSYAEQVGVS
ncbi:MAG: GtrA family protein [Eubacterium sp.]